MRILSLAAVALPLVIGGAAFADGQEIVPCPEGAKVVYQNWTLAQINGHGLKPTADFYHPSGTTGDPGAGGWTIAQANGHGLKPTADFYHPSGTAGDPDAGGWTLAQANGHGLKPTADFYHPSGTTGDPVGDEQVVAQANGCTVMGKIDSAGHIRTSGM